MSGAEAVAVLGVISSIIAIVDKAKQAYDAAKDVGWVPRASFLPFKVFLQYCGR